MPALIIEHRDRLSMRIDLTDSADIAVKNAHASLDHEPEPSAHLPFKLVIVFDLHDLVASSNEQFSMPVFRFSGAGRIQLVLKDLIQSFHSQQALSCRRKDLQLLPWGIHVRRKLVLHKIDHVPDDPVCVISFQEEKVPAFIIRPDMLAVIDLVRIDHDIAFHRLPEYVIQPDDLHRPGFDDIPQYTAGSHGWQLAGISDQDQSCSRNNGGEKRMHQVNVDHGHLIHDQDVHLQRIGTVPPESIRFILHGAFHLQEPVDGLSLPAGGLGHSLGGPAGRCRQRDLFSFGVKIREHGIDRCGLSRSGTARQYQDPAPYRFQHRTPLLFIQQDILFLLDPADPAQYLLLIDLKEDPQIAEHLGRIQFSEIQRCQVYILLLDHDLSFHGKIAQIPVEIFYLNLQQIPSPFKEHFRWQIHMSLAG